MDTPARRDLPDALGARGTADTNEPPLPGEWSRPKEPLPPPARMLPAPIPLGKVTSGGVVVIGDSPKGLVAGAEPHLFAIEKMEHLMRLDSVEWWTKSPASRDYARAWLVSGGEEGAKSARGANGGRAAKAACAEALLYIVRKTGEVYLQGWYE
jgi:protein ImuB